MMNEGDTVCSKECGYGLEKSQRRGHGSQGDDDEDSSSLSRRALG